MYHIVPAHSKESERMQANPQAIPSSGGRERMPGGGGSYRWIMASVLILGVFMSILDTTIVNIAIPRLQTAFGTDLHSVQWVLTVYTLTLGVATPASTFLLDWLGSKRL